MRRLVVVGALVAVAGCAGSATLTTDRGSYRPGERIALTLTNHGRQELGYNLCGSSVERKEGGQWVTAAATDGGTCEAVLLLLHPGARTSAEVRLRDDAPAGEYRIHDRGDWRPNIVAGRAVGHTGSVSLQSNAFTVER